VTLPIRRPEARSRSSQPTISDWKYSPGSRVTRSDGGIRTSAPRRGSAASIVSTPSNLKTSIPLWSQTSSTKYSSPEPKRRTRLRLAKRSGWLDCEIAVISPRMPRGRPRIATVTQSASAAASSEGALLKNLQRVAAIELHAGRAQNGADGPRGAALLADHFAQIPGSDFQLKHGHLLAIDGSDHDVLWNIDQRFRDIFNELFHRLPLTVPRRLRGAILKNTRVAD